MTHNVVSISGGKDSTATLLLAIALETENLQAVFADTGHEHAQTYEYIDYSTHGIDRMVEWARTDRGGRQFSLIPMAEEKNACSSAYGLCE